MVKFFIRIFLIFILTFYVMKLFAGTVVISEKNTDIVKYASNELVRYIYSLTGDKYDISNQPNKNHINFILGKIDQNEIKQYISDMEYPINDGYILKKINEKDFIIASNTDIGILYGIYGLLEEYFKVGFYLDGDHIPSIGSIKLPNISKTISPRERIRGFLPWTNFPQSATSWSFKDYTFIIDQMAKMRFNFLEIHNYNGFADHNEMFHNFSLDGKISRTWMPTSDTGHAWAGPQFSIKDYRFGASDIFDDYAFGADCALHNKSLSYEEISSKGISEFAKIIDYAHLRGVKIGLGIELDAIPSYYGASFDNEDVINARIDQIINDYPHLDYILFYRSEIAGHEAGDKWEKVFYKFYERLKKEAPQIKMAVSGWGMDPINVEKLPEDVICAPIAPYSASFETGKVYGNREYWGCPWLERDFNSSVHYYPYNINLSDTIKSYSDSDSNMTGFMCLTWRNADAVDAKMSYIAKAPWYSKNKYSSSKDVYSEYAKIRYGLENAEDLIDIINENEAYASNASECEETPELSGADRSIDKAKALEQMKIVKKYIDLSKNSQYKSNLERLYERLYGIYTFCLIDQNYNKADWSEMPYYFDEWTKSFIKRVTDISSLGNVISTQNRFVNLRYIPREKLLREINNSPYNLKIYRNSKSAKIYFEYDNNDISGFNVYVNEKKVNTTPFKNKEYTIYLKSNAIATIQVATVSKNGVECGKSIPLTSDFKKDIENSLQIVVSPPTSVLEGENAEITVRYFAENIDSEYIKPLLYYKEINENKYKKISLNHRNGNVFSTSLPIKKITEYYITNNLNNQKYINTIIPYTIDELSQNNIDNVKIWAEKDNSITWIKSENAYWYKIYRSKKSDFDVDYANFLTYVPSNTLRFKDVDKDFNAMELSGKYYYKITVVDKFGRESSPSNKISIKYKTSEELKLDPYYLTPSDAVITGCQLYNDFEKGIQGIGYFGESVGDSITFNKKIPNSKGFTVQYSSISDTICTVYIDGTKQNEKISFKSTGDWYTYSFVTINTPINKSISFVCEEDDLEYNNSFICNVLSIKLEK